MTSYACSFIKDIEISDTRRYALEGYMMPGNYQLIKESSASNVVQVFLDQFSIEYTASLQQKVEESGYTLDEIVTMASMIQEECAVKTDFAIMSSMLYNRMSFRDDLLNHWNMLSSVLYAQHRSEDELISVTEVDKGYDSPYNTFLNKGFTPGPICNPSMDAIKAVLYPQETNYYFYEIDYANPNGARHFSQTEAEHNLYLEAQSTYGE